MTDCERAWKRLQVGDTHAIFSPVDDADMSRGVERWLQIDDSARARHVSKHGIAEFDKLSRKQRTRDVYIALVTSSADNLRRVPPKMRNAAFYIDVLGANPDAADRWKNRIPPRRLVTPKFFQALIVKYPQAENVLHVYGYTTDDIWTTIVNEDPARIRDWYMHYPLSFDAYANAVDWPAVIAKHPEATMMALAHCRKRDRQRPFIDDNFCRMAVRACPRVTEIVPRLAHFNTMFMNLNSWYRQAIEVQPDAMPFIDLDMVDSSFYYKCMSCRLLHIRDVPLNKRSRNVIVGFVRAYDEIPYDYIPDDVKTPELYATCVSAIRGGDKQIVAINSIPREMMLSIEMYDMLLERHIHRDALLVAIARLLTFIQKQ